ncbi:hypothetical protein ACCW94_02895 [Enterobacter soli]|uniref:hypothetical protein n=1 Tax=Enterobacter soli TaxID=885040 RepID=UPI003EDA3111
MKIKSLAAALAAVIACVSVSGCALTVDGKTQPVAIKTNAPALYTIKNDEGATVASGVAPATVNLRRDGAPYTVSLKRTDDSQEATSQITDNLNGWLWGDLLCGIIVCGGVDLATGAAWDLDESVTVDTVANVNSVNVNSPLNTVNAGKQPVVINNTLNNTNNH